LGIARTIVEGGEDTLVQHRKSTVLPQLYILSSWLAWREEHFWEFQLPVEEAFPLGGVEGSFRHQTSFYIIVVGQTIFRIVRVFQPGLGIVAAQELNCQA